MSITMDTALASLVPNKRRVSALKSLGVTTVGEALTYYPFRVTEPVPLRTIREAVLCGDFNIAHTPLDIKNAKANEKHAGFLPEERAYVDKWLDEYEFVDVMRSLAGDIQGPYTWWSQRGRAFDNNVGWRIDYQFATPELAETARGFVIDKAPTYDKRWSDHAPLTITYEV